MFDKHNKFEIEVLMTFLNSNSRKIFTELILAKKNNMWATVIVFSLTILENIFHQQEMSDLVNGLELNKIKYSKDISWLRKKRNQILHYENGFEGKNIVYLNDEDLKKNSIKAYNILCKNLIRLYK